MNKLIHFTANWCAPCKKSQPVVDKFINSTKIEYEQIDVDLFPDKAKEYNILGVPTFISYKDGKQYDRHVGVATNFLLQGMFNL
jgi:thioredoxin 1